MNLPKLKISQKTPGNPCMFYMLKKKLNFRKQSVEVKKRKPSRVASISKDLNKKTEKASDSKTVSDADVYGTLDASRTLLLHGLESDFIEEQMADDEVFRFIFHSANFIFIVAVF